MNQINIGETNNELVVQFPFDLRDAFRAIFKTAPWDGTRRAYVLKNTSANKNKLAAFVAAAEPLLSTIADADHAEATVIELERMRAALESTRLLIADRAARTVASRRQLDALRTLLDPLVAEAAAATDELTAVKTEREQALEPVKALCAELGVPRAISSLRYFSSRPFVTSQQKDEFGERCRSLRSASMKLAEKLGITLPFLDELADANHNRLDKLKDLFLRYDDIYTGLQKVVT